MPLLCLKAILWQHAEPLTEKEYQIAISAFAPFAGNNLVHGALVMLLSRDSTSPSALDPQMAENLSEEIANMANASTDGLLRAHLRFLGAQISSPQPDRVETIGQAVLSLVHCQSLHGNAKEYLKEFERLLSSPVDKNGDEFSEGCRFIAHYLGMISDALKVSVRSHWSNAATETRTLRMCEKLGRSVKQLFALGQQFSNEDSETERDKLVNLMQAEYSEINELALGRDGLIVDVLAPYYIDVSDAIPKAGKAAREFCEANDIQCGEYVLDPDVEAWPTIVCDPTVFHEFVKNTVANAWQHASSGTDRIRVEWSLLPARRKRIGLVALNDGKVPEDLSGCFPKHRGNAMLKPQLAEFGGEYVQPQVLDGKFCFGAEFYVKLARES